MKKTSTIFFWVSISIGVVFSFCYWSAEEKLNPDISSCKKLTPQEAVDAVIKDVISSENKSFSDYRLVRDDIIISIYDVQIYESIAYTPFTLRKKMHKYVAMLKCSVPYAIEYSNRRNKIIDIHRLVSFIYKH